MAPDTPSEASGRGRLLRLAGWVAAANGIAVALAVMPAKASAEVGFRAVIAWCGIG